MARRWSTEKKIGAVGGLLLIALYAAYLGVAPFSVSVREGSFGADWANGMVDIASRCKADTTTLPDGNTYKYHCDLSDKQYGNIAVRAGTQTFVGGGAGFSDPGSGGGVYYTEDFSTPGDKFIFNSGIKTRAAPNGVKILSSVRWPEKPVPWTHDRRSGGHIINLAPVINTIRYEGSYQDESGVHYFSYIAPNTNTHLYRLDGTKVTDGTRLYDETGKLVSWTSVDPNACAPQPDASGELACIIFPEFSRYGKDVIFKLNGGIRVQDQPYQRWVRLWSATVEPSQALPVASLPLSILGDFVSDISVPLLFTSTYFNSVPFCIVGDAFCSGDPVTTKTPVGIYNPDFAMAGEFESTSCFAGTWAGMVSCSWLFKGHIYFTEFDGEPVTATGATIVVATPGKMDINFCMANTQNVQCIADYPELFKPVIIPPEVQWYGSLTPQEKLWADDAVKAGWSLDKVMAAYKEMGYAQRGIPGYTYEAKVKTPNDGLHLEPASVPSVTTAPQQTGQPTVTVPPPSKKPGFWAWLLALVNKILRRG